MSKQMRLNFSRAASSPSSKRRKLNSNEAINEQNDVLTQDSVTTDTLEKDDLSRTRSTTKTSSQASGRTKHHKPSDSKSTPPRVPTTDITKPHLTLTYKKASLFASNPATVLCHATNAQGSWGAGIAAAFKKSYPAAFKIYATHCSKWDSSSLLGTTLLIPPQKKSATKAEREADHWIGCLFTSEKKGKGKGSKESILAATTEAVEDLVRQVRAVNEASEAKEKFTSGEQDRIAAIHMCKINSGLFGVPWEATSAVIEAIETSEGDVGEIAVYSMD